VGIPACEQITNPNVTTTLSLLPDNAAKAAHPAYSGPYINFRNVYSRLRRDVGEVLLQRNAPINKRIG